ncbi:MAG TPA: hypothetical protein VFG86_05155, partial [Chloroflexota bacterium]|nr:hypothetical protein [Chloroflexota bacterium]
VVLAEVNPLGVGVKADGSLQGTFASAPATANYQVVPTIGDVDDGVIRYDIASNILVNAQTRRAHVQAISALVAQNSLPGVQLDYRGLLPDIRDMFSRFVQELSGELHARGKTLSVRVPLPTQLSDDDFESGAYDWQALGAAADALQVPAPASANAYKPGGAMDQLLRWAVAHVNRYKLVLALDTRVQDHVNNQTTERGYDEALKALLGKIQVEGVTSDGTRPQQQVRLSLALVPGFQGFTRDADTQAFVYGYLDPSANLHTVYLENADSVAFKLALAGRYHLRGVSFSGLLSRGADPSLWDAIARFQQSVPASAPKYQLVWTVTDSSGQQVQASAPQDLLAPLSFLWKAAPAPDRYTIGVVISSPLSSLPGDTLTIQVVNSTSPTPARVTSAPLAPRRPETTPGPTRTPTVTRTPAPARTPTPTRTPAAPRPTNPPAPAPSNGGSFGYGIQVDPNDNLSFVVAKIKQMGFGWVKLQMPWKDVQPAPGVYNWWDGRINTFANNGIKVMLSIVKAPRWARPAGSDFSQEGPPSDEHIGDFANFLGQVASRYQGKVGAIEVWNEENIRNEWGGEPFDAARYVRILCAGFAQIKASNWGMIVISGALTPTGAPPPLAVND